MRILSAIVVAQPARPMTIDEAQAIERSTIGSQSVSDDCLWLDFLVLQQSSQESKRRCSIASFLHDHVHNLAFVIDRPPNPHVLTGYR